MATNIFTSAGNDSNGITGIFARALASISAVIDFLGRSIADARALRAEVERDYPDLLR